jgi:hypothetical protein
VEVVAVTRIGPDLLLEGRLHYTRRRAAKGFASARRAR